MRRFVPAIITTAVTLSLAVIATGCRASLPKTEEQNWVRYTVPLPKSIEITDKVVVPRGSVAISVPASDNMVVKQAVTELTDAVGREASGTPAFTIMLALGGDEAKPLKPLKNSYQAYRIYPYGEKQLRVVALQPSGLYYGAKTLQQLIRAKSAGGSVSIPIVKVTDWPDMEDRGLWGSDNYDHLKWLADRKMNWMEQISAEGVNPDGTSYAGIKKGREPLITEGPKYAIKPVPVVLHLEQSSQHGVFDAYPELRGKSEHKGVMCYSQPKTAMIIADWIQKLGTLPNVQSVDVWMSENLQGHKGCQCDLCKAAGVDPMVLEARSIVKAWRIAGKRSGKDIGLRILTSEATEDYNKTIISELPKDVKLIYYHSLLTYTCGRQPQLRPYLAEFAKNGGWLAPCLNISTVVGCTGPFTSAQFVHYRMKEYSDKGCSGLLGYATPRVHFNAFNVEAAAEWAWNMKGRSPREFEISYAVRSGIKDPEMFADYADAVGAVLWDCYGSDWPQRMDNTIVGPVDQQLRKGKLPGLGFVLWDFIRLPFGNIDSEKQLDNDLALADRAYELAGKMGVEEYVQESREAQGLIRSLKALYELRGIANGGKIAPENKEAAARYFGMFIDSLKLAEDALPAWEKTVRRETDPWPCTERPTKMIHDQIDRMKALAADMGVATGQP